MKSKLALLLLVICLTGCFSTRAISTKKVVVLPEERHYLLPAGEVVNVIYKGEKVSTSFSANMYVVSSTVLVREQQDENNKALEKVKASKSTSQWIKLFGALLAVLAAAFGFWNTAFNKKPQ